MRRYIKIHVYNTITGCVVFGQQEAAYRMMLPHNPEMHQLYGVCFSITT